MPTEYPRMPCPANRLGRHSNDPPPGLPQHEVTARQMVEYCCELCGVRWWEAVEGLERVIKQA